MDIDSTLIQSLSDNDPTTSTLKHFSELRSEHERSLLLFIFRSSVFLFAGYRLAKRPTRVLLDTLKVACPYAPDNRLFVTCLPAESVKRKVAHAVRSRWGILYPWPRWTGHGTLTLWRTLGLVTNYQTDNAWSRYCEIKVQKSKNDFYCDIPPQALYQLYINLSICSENHQLPQRMSNLTSVN